MVVCSSVKVCAKSVLQLRGHFQRRMRSHMCNMVSVIPSNSCCLFLKQGNSTNKYSHISVHGPFSCLSDCGLGAFQRLQYRCCVSCRRQFPSLTVKSSVSLKGSLETIIDFSTVFRSGSLRILVPKRGLLPNVKFNVGPFSWSKGSVTTGLISGLLVCYSTSDSVDAETPEEKGVDGESSSAVDSSQGRKVYTDYSVIGIPGDGRCLFRSVAHGACLRSGKPAPNERLQKELADELRARVADEFIRRRQETEWFIEGDFNTYVSQIRKPHVWGGEPELLMLSHVLRMPITVYMHDNKHGGLISIAEYGQEYGKDNPIRVLYHGYGHYDALLIPGKKGAVSRL